MYHKPRLAREASSVYYVTLLRSDDPLTKTVYQR